MYIKKWIDHSQKYGVGFLLSNETIGVLFNDCTKIVQKKNALDFVYCQRWKVKGAIGCRQDVYQRYPLNAYPELLEKKVHLFVHFKNYLQSCANIKG